MDILQNPGWEEKVLSPLTANVFLIGDSGRRARNLSAVDTSPTDRDGGGIDLAALRQAGQSDYDGDPSEPRLGREGAFPVHRAILQKVPPPYVLSCGSYHKIERTRR